MCAFGIDLQRTLGMLRMTMTRPWACWISPISCRIVLGGMTRLRDRLRRWGWLRREWHLWIELKLREQSWNLLLCTNRGWKMLLLRCWHRSRLLFLNWIWRKRWYFLRRLLNPREPWVSATSVCTSWTSWVSSRGSAAAAKSRSTGGTVTRPRICSETKTADQKWCRNLTSSTSSKTSESSASSAACFCSPTSSSWLAISGSIRWSQSRSGPRIGGFTQRASLFVKSRLLRMAISRKSPRILRRGIGASRRRRTTKL